MSDLLFYVAFDVHVFMLKNPGYGSQRRAILAVSKKYRRDPQWVKKAFQRRPIAWAAASEDFLREQVRLGDPSLYLCWGLTQNSKNLERRKQALRLMRAVTAARSLDLLSLK